MQSTNTNCTAGETDDPASQVKNLDQVLATVSTKLRTGALLSTGEVAALTGFHPESVRRACRRGHLRGTRPAGIRDVLIHRADLANWLKIPLAKLLGEAVAA